MIVTRVDAILLKELPLNMGAETALVAGFPKGVRRWAPRLRNKTPRVVGGRIGRLTPGRVWAVRLVSGSMMALTKSLKPGEFVAHFRETSSLNQLLTAVR